MNPISNKTELVAGATTFITMAYIIFVNPAILSTAGVPFGAVATATCIGAGVMSILMGLYAKYPFALAPGMGINAVVAFTICGQMGLPFSVAMGMIVVEGIIVTILVLTKTREAVMDAIPTSLKLAIGVGIGIFIAFIGLTQGGIIDKHPVTAVTLGDLRANYTITTIVGLFTTIFLLARRVKASILIGIIITAIFGFVMGVVNFENGFFSFPSDFSLFFAFDIPSALHLSLLPLIFSLFLTDFFDTMGTVIAVGEEGNFLDDKKKLPRLKNVLLVDSVAAILGGMVGSSSITTYIESAAGVAEGGKRGTTSIITGILFLGSLFVIPFVSAIGGGYKVAEGIYKYPVTAPALIVVGFLMISAIRGIDFKKIEEGIPAFFTIIGMPLTYNISNGIGFGIVSYALIQVFSGKARTLNPLIYLMAILFIIGFII